MLVAVAVKLFAVTLVIAGGLIVLARQAKRGGRQRGAAVRVAARQGLSRNAIVAVVEIDGRRFLVGAGDQQVSLLTELDPAEEIADEATASAVDTRSLMSRFGAFVGAAYEHARTAPHRTAVPSTTTGPRIGPLDRLREMTVRTEGPIRVDDL